MNKLRRKELTSLIKDLRVAQEKSDLYDSINILENIKDDEEAYYDNIPENLQNSQRACDSEDAIDNMNEALDLLETAYQSENKDQWRDIISKAIDKISIAKY